MRRGNALEKFVKDSVESYQSDFLEESYLQQSQFWIRAFVKLVNERTIGITSLDVGIAFREIVEEFELDKKDTA